MRDFFFFFFLHSIHHEDLHFEGNAIWIFSKLNIWSLPGLYSPASLFELSMQWPGCLHSGWSFSYATFHRFRWGWWLFEELNIAQFSSPRGLPLGSGSGSLFTQFTHGTSVLLMNALFLSSCPLSGGAVPLCPHSCSYWRGSCGRLTHPALTIRFLRPQRSHCWAGPESPPCKLGLGGLSPPGWWDQWHVT